MALRLSTATGAQLSTQEVPVVPLRRRRPWGESTRRHGSRFPCDAAGLYRHHRGEANQAFEPNRVWGLDQLHPTDRFGTPGRLTCHTRLRGLSEGLDGPPWSTVWLRADLPSEPARIQPL